MIAAVLIAGFLAAGPQLTPLEGDALHRTFSGRRFDGYLVVASGPAEAFHADGRYQVFARVIAEGQYWVEGQGLCVRTPRQAAADCRYFAIAPDGQVFQVGADRDGVRHDFPTPYAIILTPLEGQR